MDSFEDMIQEKKVMLLGILGALAISVSVDRCDKLVENYPFFWKDKPAVVYQVQEQDPYKYLPQKPISENPHHYIPNPK